MMHKCVQMLLLCCTNILTHSHPVREDRSSCMSNGITLSKRITLHPSATKIHPFQNCHSLCYWSNAKKLSHLHCSDRKLVNTGSGSEYFLLEKKFWWWARRAKMWFDLAAEVRLVFTGLLQYPSSRLFLLVLVLPLFFHIYALSTQSIIQRAVFSAHASHSADYMPCCGLRQAQLCHAAVSISILRPLQNGWRRCMPY